jgi:hypothetical protein
MDKKEDFQQIIEKYDFGKFTAESAELFDIAQKYLFRKERIKEWYLKPLYQAAYALALFLAEIKSRYALKKLQNIKMDTRKRVS